MCTPGGTLRSVKSVERRLVTSEVLRGIIDESEEIDSIDTIDPTVDGTGEIGRLLSSGPQATMCGAMISGY
jgi:hypothetical protein